MQPDTAGLAETLDQYERCHWNRVKDDGKIVLKSGKYPDWRRFQRDLHGPSVNIQSHGYAMEHVHRRRMTYREMEDDPDVDFDEYTDRDEVDYEDKPHTCEITLTPMVDLVIEGRQGPKTRP